jgi:hypothetical protein
MWCPKFLGNLCNIEELPKHKNRPIGENSPNLVALVFVSTAMFSSGLPAAISYLCNEQALLIRSSIMRGEVA